MTLGHGTRVCNECGAETPLCSHVECTRVEYVDGCFSCLPSLVLYHDQCIDGFTAAWAVHQAMPCELVPVRYYDPPPHVKGRHVVIVDFSYSRAITERMASEAASLVVLDHHASAECELDGLPYAVFDKERSGAGLAWDYYHPRTLRPWLVDFVEDRDLWRFKLPHSREVSAALSAESFSLERWTQLAAMPTPAPLWEPGRAILNYNARQIERRLEEGVRWHKLTAPSGHTWYVPVINTNHNISDFGNELCKRYPDAPFAATWMEIPDGKFQYSLRSAPHGADVSVVARLFGGGGHVHAAGFKTTSLVHR